MNDRELIGRIQSGDKSCFEELIARHYDEVYRFCCYKTGNAALSYDLTQTTFLKLIKYMGAYVHKDRFKSYLFSIALNVCNSYFRDKKHSRRCRNRKGKNRFQMILRERLTAACRSEAHWKNCRTNKEMPSSCDTFTT